MANYGRKKRNEILHKHYLYCKTLLRGSKGRYFKGFNDLAGRDYKSNKLHKEDRMKVATLTEDEWVAYAEGLFYEDKEKDTNPKPQPHPQPQRQQIIFDPWDGAFTQEQLGVLREWADFLIRGGRNEVNQQQRP